MRFVIFLLTLSCGFNTWAENKTLCGANTASREHRGIYTNAKGKKIKVCVEEVACTEFHIVDHASVDLPISSLRKIACRPDSDNICPIGDQCVLDQTVPDDEVDDIKLIKRHSRKSVDTDNSDDNSNSDGNASSQKGAE